MKLYALLGAVLLACPAQAATITLGGPGTGQAVDLDVNDFTKSGPCGSGGSVVADGCSVVLKTDPTAPDAFGRFDPLAPPSSWIDSQDLSEVTWTITQDVLFTSLTFALTDAYDQAESPIFGKSYFSLLVDGAEWSIDSRQANGNLYWLTVSFTEPTKVAALTFLTRLNDGWGVSRPTVAPVPLPAAAGLLLSGLGAFAFLRRRRKTA